MNGTDGFPELRNWAVQPWIALVREAVRIPVLPPRDTFFNDTEGDTRTRKQT
jgi:hypothetical protein